LKAAEKKEVSFTYVRMPDNSRRIKKIFMLERFGPGIQKGSSISSYRIFGKSFIVRTI